MTRELRTQRAKLIEDAKALNVKAEAEKRNLSTEEKATFDKMIADAAELKERYERIESTDELQKELGETQSRSLVDPLKGKSADVDTETRATDQAEYKRALSAYLRTGDKTAMRALSVASDGSYTIPTDVASAFVLALNRGSVVRKAGASVLATSRNTIIPTASVVTGGWEAEATTFDEADPSLTSFSANAFKYTAKMLLSNEYLQDSAIDLQSFITERFNDAIAQNTDNAYIAGSGPTSQPTGILTSATTKVVASGSTSTFTNAELLAHYFAVPAQYRSQPSFAWVANDNVIGFIAAMANALSAPIIPFKYGDTPGSVDTLFGKPIFSSSAMPVTFDASAKLLVCGAWKYYQIVDRIAQMGIKRLSELYAETDQTMFITSFRTDGKCTLPNAFRTLQLHS